MKSFDPSLLRSKEQFSLLFTLHSSNTVTPANDIPLVPTDIKSHQLSG